MKRLLFIFVSILLHVALYAQVDNKQSFFKAAQTDLGVGLGTAFYIGDFNKIPFNTPRYYGSVFHRYSFNLLYSMRTSVVMGKIAGGANSNKIFMPALTDWANLRPTDYPDGLDVKFDRTFIDFSTGIEIGLRAFDPVLHKIGKTVASYIFIGVGFMIAYPDAYRDEIYAQYASAVNPEVYGTRDENSGSIQTFNIPIGLGIKWSPSPRWTCAFEWQFKKTLSDRIDRFSVRQGSPIVTGDWVSILGFNISYRMMPRKSCPAVQKFPPEKRSLKGINTDFDRSIKKGKKR